MERAIRSVSSTLRPRGREGVIGRWGRALQGRWKTDHSCGPGPGVLTLEPSPVLAAGLGLGTPSYRSLSEEGPDVLERE